ncbi:DUF1302 family protein [Motiliproteus coralliicola]|uniref:DUF1302 family protein n=1 Tax=Motiliproteus coralliicola TaxID=2283196 RepID=A0A369WQM3_9GAMM|nr:DUF1302 family protein [Motiliproteus coralliicola]RDE24388.1 DUF1302 family protein [Motiliproteus coralliicola]
MKIPLSRSAPGHWQRNKLSHSVARSCLALALGAATAPQAMALSFELENGVTIDWDTTLTYDVQWRMEEPDNAILTQAPLNGLATDDGNRNFDKYDKTQNRLSFSTDLDVNYGDGGVFLRARGWYDDVYNDDSLSQEKALGSFDKPYQNDGIDIHKDDIELLDAFVYHTFDLDERSLNLRVGRQVVNWGESLFINGGISSAQGPLDATKANSPGVELKDIFLPIGQVYAEMDLTDVLSVGAYYQWEWEKTRLDAPGTYFNALEVLGQEADGDSVPVLGGLGLTSTVDREEPDEGQFGVALRYLAEDLNNTEFGFYALRFNDFAPTVNLVPSTLVPTPGVNLGDDNVHVTHFEDIEVYGASFGTVLGDTNVSGEFNYRDGQPVRLNTPGLFYYSEAETVQAQLSLMHIFGESALWDNLVVMGEIGHFRVLDLKDDARATALGVNLKDKKSALHGNSPNSSGFVVRASADYFTIANGLDLKVTATYRNDFDGISPMIGGFTEGVEVLGLKADFTYTGGHSFGASYTRFMHEPQDIIDDQGSLQIGHLTADRDNFALYYKYRF